MSDKSYNGWSSYETWNVKLWLDNDQYLQEWQEETVKHSRDVINRYNRLSQTMRDSKFVLADMVKDYVTDTDNGLIPDLGATMASDLLGSALDNVNWVEIAESMLSDYEEEQEDTEDESEDDTPSEPEEGDYTSSDYKNWYQYNKRVLVTPEGGEDYKVIIKNHMERNNFYPNVWIISDHGNAHLITLQESH